MSDPFYESSEWLELRYRVLKRSNGCCELCGNPGSQQNPLQCDHIKPRSKHPELALAEGNIQVLCRHCNIGKSNKDDTAWKWRVSPHLVEAINRRSNIMATADALTKAKLAQLDWLRKSDDHEQIRKEADKEYRLIWGLLEGAYNAKKGDG